MQIGAYALFASYFIICDQSHFFFIIGIIEGDTLIFINFFNYFFIIVHYSYYLKRIRGHINRHYLLLFVHILYYCLYLKAKRTVIAIAIIGIIGIIAIIAIIHDYISFTVVPDDDLVEEPFEEPCNEPSGTRTPPTPDVSAMQGGG